MKSRFRLGILSFGASDAMSWYRALGPLGELARHQMPELEFAQLMPGPPQWSSMHQADGVFIQRPYTAEAYGWAYIAKVSGVKVWVDYDDDLLNVPPEHGSWHGYEQHKQWVEKIIRLADVVTVSTVALKNAYEYLSSRIVVIPNAVNDYILRPVERSVESYNPKILAWRGGGTHREDIELARRLFTDPAYEVAYMGRNPPWFRKDMDGSYPVTDILTYFQNLAGCGARTLVVPLKRNALNLSKSNCSWLEATWMGLATCHISEDGPLEEFKRPGILTERDLRDADAWKLHESRQQSLRYVRENCLLSKVNKQREAILREWMK